MAVDGGQVGGSAAGAAGGFVFAEGHVADIVVCLDGPVLADLPRAFRTADSW